MNSQERVYNYEEGRNTVPMDNRYAFDLDKLVNAGVVFVTPAMDGDPQSPTYKEWLDEGGSHLLTLMNVLKSSENGWIRKAITKRSDTSGWKNNFVEKLYDGKYNQILWSLEKLGIDPNDMVIEDNSLQESIRRILREELNKPSEDEFKQALKDVMSLIPLISHRILHNENMEHNEENMIKINKIIFQKVKEGNDEILDEMWELAGSRIIKNAINIITFYTK